MTRIPKYWNIAKRYLGNKDKIMSKLIKNYNSPSEIILTSRKDIFFSLCKSIIGQQISVAAANSVFSKFKKKCKNRINVKTVSRLTFCRLNPHFLSCCEVKLFTILGFILFLQSFLNFVNTEFAAATLIC